MEKGYFKYLILIIVYATLVQKTETCGSIGGTDGQLFQNPTLTWTMNPPAAWTYPVTYAQTTGQFFPGQSLSQADANNQATGAITAAALEALAGNNLPTQGVRIISNYQPQMVSDCVKIAGTTPLPALTNQGEIFGIYEGGAITQLATANTAAGITLVNCVARTFTAATLQPNILHASLTINGISLIGSQLKLVAAQIQTQLNFNSRVRFVTPITYA